MKYKVEEIKGWDCFRDNGKLARSGNYKFESCYSRVKNAFMVLIGKYDAIEWEK